MSNIVFRTDASLSMGTGHVMRCLTLAEVLRDKGTTVFFVCRLHEGNLCDLIKQRGFKLKLLPAPEPNFHPEADFAYAGWLGTSWQDDVEQTQSVVGALGVKPNWLIVDHYAIDQRWESTLRPLVEHIMVIDDLANRQHDCDLLLDQNLVENMQGRYEDRVSEHCTFLLGPQYALLQPIYADLHERIPPHEGPIKRILIFFGGTGEHNLTGLSLQAFLNLDRRDIEADVVIRRNNPHVQTICAQADSRSNVHLHFDLPSLAPLMVQADLAIGAGGATSWERLCLGVPSIVITVAENQQLVAEYLQKKGLIYWLGDKDNVDGTSLTAALVHTLNMSSLLDWSNRCLQVCSGQGVRRVLTAMMATMKSKIFQSLPQNLA